MVSIFRTVRNVYVFENGSLGQAREPQGRWVQCGTVFEAAVSRMHPQREAWPFGVGECSWAA